MSARVGARVGAVAARPPGVRETSAADRLATDMPRISLLDVNVLIALCDGRHEHHEHAARWFLAHAPSGWASCPLT